MRFNSKQFEALQRPNGNLPLSESDLRFALSYNFGREWSRLSAADQTLIVRDCTEDGGVDDIQQYRRSIGAGNLDAYVKTQRVRFSR